ncbi:hypothetical protein EMCG_00502 [[Emmonsia] crescens]|uniref:Uncharacterized protein n=1 Tax=[Emmonsia] crescens TaxID=73230 RepID=A0A0G2HW08_9EURO|nr:hypothetical protein EMCG_00502 [Emmonsia crescens UAMH 3008]
MQEVQNQGNTLYDWSGDLYQGEAEIGKAVLAKRSNVACTYICLERPALRNSLQSCSRLAAQEPNQVPKALVAATATATRKLADTRLR